MEVDAGSRRVVIRRGQARLDVDFVEPEALRFAQTDRFDPPPEDGKPNQWHLTASTQEKRTTVRFVTVLRPCPKGKAAPGGQPERIAGDGGIGVRVAGHVVALEEGRILLDGEPLVEQDRP
jgi:hypothetical protein